MDCLHYSFWPFGAGSSLDELLSDLEIYRAANQLVKRYGPDAEFHAAERADDAMLEAGDLEEQRV